MVTLGELIQKRVKTEEKKIISSKPLSPKKTRQAPAWAEPRDWENEIEFGRSMFFQEGNPIGKSIVDRWGESCGSVEAELTALAVYEVLGERLNLSWPIHRDGRVGDNVLRPCREVSVVAEEVAVMKWMPARRCWEETCRHIAREYGRTQSYLESSCETISDPDGSWLPLYRGVTGSIVEAVISGKRTDTRTLVSWTTSYHTAKWFSRRNGDGVVVYSQIRIDFVLAISPISTMVNSSEKEVLTINPSGKLMDVEVIQEQESRW